jgi:ABC-type nitrate/sulfonate/bicarbonate transport system substrate-binding protein
MTSAAALTGCHHQRREGITWALGWIPDVEYGNLWIAMDRGYFKRDHVPVSYAPGGPNAPQPVVVVAAQQANLGDAEWLPFLDAVTQGNDFVIVAAQFPVLPTGIITLPSRPMHKPADLVGGRFLVQGPSERSELEATFRLNHLPMNYKLVPAGFSPEGLLHGDGDAYFCYITNQPTMLENMGLKRDKDFFVTRIYDLGYKVPSSLLFVDRETYTHHRADIVAFLRGLLQARERNLANLNLAPRLAVEHFGADLGLDLEQQTTLNRLQVQLEVEPEATIPFWFPHERTINMWAAAAATGRTQIPSPDKLVDLSMLEEAYHSLTKPTGNS